MKIISNIKRFLIGVEDTTPPDSYINLGKRQGHRLHGIDEAEIFIKMYIEAVANLENKQNLVIDCSDVLSWNDKFLYKVTSTLVEDGFLTKLFYTRRISFIHNSEFKESFEDYLDTYLNIQSVTSDLD